MAVTPVIRRRQSPPTANFDPILEKLARTNTFDSDWPTLRHHLHLALLAALPVFLAQGPPPDPPAHAAPQISPGAGPSTAPTVEVKGEAPPEESLLLSPSRPPSSLNPAPSPGGMVTSSSGDVEMSSAPGMQPSTPGGLVIPPFPPLDPNRRRRSISSSPLPIAPARPNGMHTSPGAGPSRAAISINVFDDEWDEDVVIGGKKLPGWMEQEDSKKEVERVIKLLDELDYPPFTVQRLAELLLSPTKQHASIGKFLRAIEKSLLVTTPWEPPSYTYVPNATQGAARAFFGAETSSDAGSSSDSEASTMPPGATTPMFSPIPFLIHDHADDPLEAHHGINGAPDPAKMEGLMSPLMLGENNSNGDFRFADNSTVNPRSPTPEPEEGSGPSLQTRTPSTGTSEAIANAANNSPASTNLPEGHLSGSESHDPGHQPYLGRVDELDTGPISASTANGSTSEEEGQGEGGNMTPHGMSERPVPISSTTTLGSTEERRVAPLPRHAGQTSPSRSSLGQTSPTANDKKTP